MREVHAYIGKVSVTGAFVVCAGGQNARGTISCASQQTGSHQCLASCRGNFTACFKLTEQSRHYHDANVSRPWVDWYLSMQHTCPMIPDISSGSLREVLGDCIHKCALPLG